MRKYRSHLDPYLDQENAAKYNVEFPHKQLDPVYIEADPLQDSQNITNNINRNSANIGEISTNDDVEAGDIIYE